MSDELPVVTQWFTATAVTGTVTLVREPHLTRGWYDGHELHRAGGRYWFDRGYRWRGVAALVIGMVFSALCSNTPYLKGAISTHLLSGGDISAVGGFVVAGAIYWALCIWPVREQTARESAEIASAHLGGAR